MAKSSKSNRKYTCPYCSHRATRVDLVEHVENVHQDMIPENYTAARIIFNKLNNKENGNCTVCGKDTEWNEDKWIYDRICSKKCKDRYVQIRNDRMKKVYGTDNLLKDPNHQTKMLSGRSISGTYKFSDGGTHSYTGTYEKNFLEFMDKVMNFKSEDLMSPGHIIPYKFKGETLSFITDYYLIPFNLLFDIKPGGKNPNTHQGMKEYNEKQIAKENQIKKDNKYNYIRLTDNDFSQLIDILMDIKHSLMDQNKKEKVIHINENTIPVGPVQGTINQSNNDIRLIAYSSNTVTVDGYAISSDNTMNNIFVLNGNKLELTDLNFFKDKYYTIFRPKEIKDNKLEELYRIYKEQEEVSFDICYSILTESKLLSSEQLLYDNRFIKEYTSDINDNSTYIERLNEVVQTCLCYQMEDYISFPILDETNIIKKNLLLESHDTLNIMEDVNGYFVINKITNNRSISFKDMLDIPDELLKILEDIRL